MYAIIYSRWMPHSTSMPTHIGEKTWLISRQAEKTTQEALDSITNLSRPYAVVASQQADDFWPMDFLPDDLPSSCSSAVVQVLGGFPTHFLPVLGFLRYPDKVKRLPLDVIGYVFRRERDARKAQTDDCDAENEQGRGD